MKMYTAEGCGGMHMYHTGSYTDQSLVYSKGGSHTLSDCTLLITPNEGKNQVHNQLHVKMILLAESIADTVMMETTATSYIQAKMQYMQRTTSTAERSIQPKQ